MLAPIQEGATRWTSTFMMLDLFMELKDEIIQVGTTLLIPAITENIPTNPAMNAEMMDVIHVYRNLLKPFKEASIAA